MMYKSLDEFVRSLDAVHEDGIRLTHFARVPGCDMPRSTMPITAFVYEFFIYNSLYQIDWFKSISEQDFRYHEPGEEAQQKEFERFLKSLCEKDLEGLRSAFVGLKNESLSGEWTQVIPDRRVSAEDGKRFFGNLGRLQQVIYSKKLSIEQIPGIFESIAQCRGFVYSVRCNIFHGRKTLAEVKDDKQNERIRIYDIFLTCLVSSFFTLWRHAPSLHPQGFPTETQSGKPEVAFHHSQFGIHKSETR